MSEEWRVKRRKRRRSKKKKKKKKRKKRRKKKKLDDREDGQLNGTECQWSRKDGTGCLSCPEGSFGFQISSTHANISLDTG